MGRGGQLQGLAADGHGIVADTLQLDIGPDHRGQQAQVSGARQVQRNELVTHRVDLAHHAIDRMVVEDSGGGIPAENIEKVFDPFFTTKPGQMGTGLGLNICREKVEKSQGHICVVRSDENGTVMRIILPAV